MTGVSEMNKHLVDGREIWIYQITNGTKSYIGSSFRIDPKNLTKGGTRIREHFNEASSKDREGNWKSSKKISQALRKQCEDNNLDPYDALRSIYCANGLLTLEDIGITLKVLESTFDPVEGEKLERKWSEHFDSVFNGWNTAPNFRRHTTYDHIRGSKHYSKKYGSPFKGKTHSPEARQLISQARKGHSPYNKGKKCPRLSEANRKNWKKPKIRKKRILGIKIAKKGQQVYGLNPRARAVEIKMETGDVHQFDCKKRAAEFLGVSGVMLERYITEGLKPKVWRIPKFEYIKVIEIEKEYIDVLSS